MDTSKYAWVNMKKINGKLYTIRRNTVAPFDEVLICEEEAKPVKIKEIWNTGKIETHWKDKKIKKLTKNQWQGRM